MSRSMVLVELDGETASFRVLKFGSTHAVVEVDELDEIHGTAENDERRPLDARTLRSLADILTR